MRRVRATGKTKILARRALMLKIKNQTESSNTGKQTVSQLCDSWLESHKIRVTPTTHQVYESHVRLYIKPSLGKMRVADVDAVVVQTFLDHLAETGSLSKANSARMRLRQIFSWAVRCGIIERSPAAESIPYKKRHQRLPGATPEQIKAAREAFQADAKSRRPGPRSGAAHLAFEIIVATGARISEVCALKWEDVDLEGRALTFVDAVILEEGHFGMRGHLKNYDPKRISYFGDDLARLLDEQNDKTGFVVKNRGGGAMSPWNLRRTLRRVQDAAGIPEADQIAPHAIRRTVGTLVARSLGVEAAASQLGNSIVVAQRHYIEPEYKGPKGAPEALATLVGV